MAFPRKLLNDGEELILDLRPHWVGLAVPTLALLGACILGIVVALASLPTPVVFLALLLVVVAAVWFAIGFTVGWIVR